MTLLDLYDKIREIGNLNNTWDAELSGEVEIKEIRDEFDNLIYDVVVKYPISNSFKKLNFR